MSNKHDLKILQILDKLRLRINQVGQLTRGNLASVVILAMREIEKMNLTGERKKECVTDLILLLSKEYAVDTLELTVQDVYEIIEDLHSIGVLIKKSGCCY